MKKTERAHDGMAKRLEIAEALSTRTLNELIEKEKMIQEQAKLIEEKKRRVSMMHCVLMQRWRKVQRKVRLCQPEQRKS